MSAPIASEYGPDFVVSLISAFGTVTAVAVALFAQHFRPKFFPPILRLRIYDTRGEQAKAHLSHPVSPSRMESVVYYHVRVENERRWSTAHNVRVFLLKLERLGVDGKPYIEWSSDGIPLKWQFQEVHPQARAIGHAANVDLVSVVKDKFLELHPLIKPHALDTRYEGGCDIYLTLQARSDEADSPELRVRIAWDGGWHVSREEMLRCFSVREVPLEPGPV